jgi:hypothetical protein
MTVRYLLPRRRRLKVRRRFRTVSFLPCWVARPFAALPLVSPAILIDSLSKGAGRITQGSHHPFLNSLLSKVEKSFGFLS